MSVEIKEKKKELAKRKRKASEIASQIHDIVEDTLWSDYDRLPELSDRIVAAVEEAKAYQKAQGL